MWNGKAARVGPVMRRPHPLSGREVAGLGGPGLRDTVKGKGEAWEGKNRRFSHPRNVLLKHVGNMGDHLFLVGALLEGLARAWPKAHVTLVTAWGYKDRHGRWGKRNQDGYCIALMKENPHIDDLVHWSDADRSLDARICVEEGRAFPTWDREAFEHAKDDADVVAELEFGLGVEDNPLERFAAAVGLEGLHLGPYPLYLTPSDVAVGRAVAASIPRPRVALLEGLGGRTMRGWDPAKTTALAARLQRRGVSVLWWGAQYMPILRGRTLTLRENIAFLRTCDLAIGVLGAPLHFAAAAGVQTLCLYGAQSYRRAAPGFAFNASLADPAFHHVTIFGPTCDAPCLLKRELPCKNLLGDERTDTGFRSWQDPGRQSDKSCIAVIPVETVLAAATDALERRGLLGKSHRTRTMMHHA